VIAFGGLAAYGGLLTEKNPVGSEEIMWPIRMFMSACVAILMVALFLDPDVYGQTTAKPGTVIQAGSEVTFDYTLTDESGTVIDSSKGKGKEPMHYIHGQRQIIPGLEKELAGMAVGGEKKVTLKPEDAYGSIDPHAFQEIPKDRLPPGALKVGTMLMAQGPQGQGVPARVHEIKEKTVIMDFNHPLAGKTLSFDIKITGIKMPK
jgi:FKBP-type peptidyl-prolyl cis-trans isomerase SlyD